MDYSLKPNYHFFPITGWMNDPNGLLFWKGYYHLFYQYNPSSPKWGPMHWGHAVSRDLLHWRHLPVALYPPPTQNRDDESGIFSGSAVNHDGKMYLFFTCHKDPILFPEKQRETQCLAFSKNGVDFEKYAYNPVIPLPPDHKTHDFRDPKIWKTEKGDYRAVIGSGVSGRGKILLFSSKDIYEWQYEGVLLELDPEEYGPALECPDFFCLNNKWVLFFSAGYTEKGRRQNYYATGDFDGKRLKPDHISKLDLARDVYAAQSFEDANKRRIYFGWMHNPERTDYSKYEGWAGVQTIPRELTLENGELKQRPVKEIEALYEESKDLNSNNSNTVDIKSFDNSLFLQMKIDQKEKTVVLFRGKESRLEFKIAGNVINTVEKRVDEEVQTKEYPLKETVHSISLYLDKTLFELFINDGNAVLSQRIFPDGAYRELSLKGSSSNAIKKLSKVKSVWL